MTLGAVRHGKANFWAAAWRASLAALALLSSASAWCEGTDPAAEAAALNETMAEHYRKGEYGRASEEILSIKAADFLLNQDPSGANWIRLNKSGGGASGGGRGGRGERRRRRAG